MTFHFLLFSSFRRHQIVQFSLSRFDDFDEENGGVAKRYPSSERSSSSHRSNSNNTYRPAPSSRSPTPTKAYRSTSGSRHEREAGSPSRRNSPTGSLSYVDPQGDLRDSLNRNRMKYRDSSAGRYRDGGKPGNDLMSTPHSPGTSSGDEATNSAGSNASKKNGGVDSGLSSEDHGSTGSAVSTDDLPSVHGAASNHHDLGHSSHRDRHAGSSSGHHNKHLSVKIYDSKVRRPSSDSARSSAHGNLDYDQLSDVDERRHRSDRGDRKHSTESDASRPGTPLCDERPEENSNDAASNRGSASTTAPIRLSSIGSRISANEPMSLPLPRFAQSVLHGGKGGSHSLLSGLSSSGSSSSKKDRDPRLKSPPIAPPPSDPGLKSPPPLKSPGAPRHSFDSFSLSTSAKPISMNTPSTTKQSARLGRVEWLSFSHWPSCRLSSARLPSRLDAVSRLWETRLGQLV